MKPMDEIQVWTEKLKTADVSSVLYGDERKWWEEIEPNRREELLAEMFAAPVNEFGAVYLWYFRAKWLEALRAVHPQAPLRLLEIGAGSMDTLPRTMGRSYVHPDTQYCTVNQNDRLSDAFLTQIDDLPIRCKVIRDDAARIEAHLEGELFDVLAFEHSINDILYAMLGEMAGLDTVTSEWFEIWPTMIRLISQAYMDGTLEAKTRQPLLTLLETCLKTLKPGGYMIIDHFMYQLDLDEGMNYELWDTMLPIVRPWILSLEGIEEVAVEGFSPDHWMFVRKR